MAQCYSSRCLGCLRGIRIHSAFTISCYSVKFFPSSLLCIYFTKYDVQLFTLGTYKVLHGPEPGYLGPFTRVADLPSRRSLRSVGSNRLTVPSARLSTVGSRAFPVVGIQTRNNLPEDVTSADSLSAFRRLLKTHLFRKSFPDYMLDIN